MATVSLPTPDAVGALALGSTNGKVLLMASDPVAVCPAPSAANYIDLVDYNSNVSCAEGTKLGSLSNLQGAVRNGGGCTDTDNNLADFTVMLMDGVSTAPRTSASPVGPTCQ